MSPIKDSLGAVSLMFTVLTFFVSRRVDTFEEQDLESIGVSSGIQALLDLVLAGVAAFVLVIIWPLLDESGAFGGFTKTEDVLPNLLGLIAIGFGLLGLIEAGLGLTRLIGGIVLALKSSSPGR
jgi:hypothetical protein